MKKLLFIIAFLSSGFAALAQIPGTASAAPKGSGKVTGYLIDSTENKPVDFASVALISQSTNKPVDGAVADQVGKFSMSKIPNGQYKLVVSFLGYNSKTIAVEISAKNDNVDLGIIKMVPSAKVLQEVTVEGQRVLIEEKVDRTVYNAEKDETNKGGDATDVLKKVPMLSVDLDGNPSLRGSTNVKVLINNKPSTIMASSIADALKQIPADMIKTVEVITSPSARYDAEGSSGIINIVTKKNTLQGLTYNFDSSVGIRGSNLSMSGNFRNKTWGLSLGGFGRSEYNVSGTFNSIQRTIGSNGGTTENLQSSESRRQGLFGNYQLGFDWDINKQNSLTGSARFGLRNGNNWQDNLQQIRNGVLNSLRNTNSLDQSANMDINIDYTKTFDKPQKEFSILTFYSRNNRTNDFYNDIMNPNSTMSQIMSSIKNENISYNQEATFQLDYQTPITKTQMIEFGGKGIVRNVSSDYSSFINPTGNNEAGYRKVNLALLPSNVFDYDQNILSAYSSYTFTTKNKWSVKMGARYEYTTIDARQKEGASWNIPSYGALVPSVNFSKNLRKGTWRFSFNRRLQRPSIQFLNPNVNASNPLIISTGNPALDPEFTNNYEVGYSTFFKQTYISSALFVRHATGAITNIRQVVGDTIKSKPFNIGSETAYGLNFNSNINLSNNFMLGGGADLSYVVLANNVPDPLLNAKNEGFVANFRMFSNYTLGKGWGLQAFGFYRAKQVQLQGTQGGFGVYSLSVRRDFKNKKGSFGFGAENFLAEGIRVRNETITPTIQQTSTSFNRNLSFKVNFSFRFGQMSFTGKRKKSVNNDDQKDGDSAPATPQPMMGPGGGGMRGGFGGGGFGGGRGGN